MKYITLILMACLLAWVSLALARSLNVRSMAANFVGGIRRDLCTCNAAQLEEAKGITDLRFDLRTANGRLAQNLYAGSRLPEADSGPWSHGRITTANDSLFGSTHLSEPMTNYATGWSDPEGYDALIEFLAPNFQAPAELFQHLQFNNAEEFLSDNTYDDLRAINADFKTVDYTQGQIFRKVLNRGLRIELDWDRIKNDPIWQQRYTGKLLSRLKRNQARRAAALGIASATSAPLVWNGTSTQPDIDLNNQLIQSGNASGIRPNRVLIGEPAWQVRIAAYGASASVSAAAGLMRSVEQVGALLSVQTMMDSGRYQAGASKASIIGSNILSFIGKPGVDAEDPTNFKLAWVACQNGTRFAVYVRQVSVKKWEIVVEHYELLFAASTLGVRLNAITAS